MSSLVLAVTAAVAFGAAATSSSAQAPAPGLEVTAMVQEEAFNPASYFPSRFGHDRSIVRISYTGDDYAWPVYSIAIAEGCLDGETVAINNCASRLRARMVRAPAVPNADRPRLRGAALVRKVNDKGARSPEEVRQILAEMDLEWVEADLRTCPGALTTLAQSAQAEWAPDAITAPTPDDDLAGLVMHADVIQVDLQQFHRLTTYRGWIAERSPAAWASAMAATLEPCWKPSPAPPPWQRAM